MIALIGIWLFLIAGVKKTYVNSFRSAIEKRAFDFDKEPLRVQDPVVVRSLLKTLETARNERQICFILDALKETRDERIIPYITRLLEHDSGEIVARCVAFLRRQRVEGFLMTVRELASHPHRGVREEAILYELVFSEREPELLQEYLEHENVLVRAAALKCAARAYEANTTLTSSKALRKLITNAVEGLDGRGIGDKETQAFIRMNTAEVIGIVNESELYPLLQRLLNGNSTFPVAAAAICSAGKTQSPIFVERLVDFLSEKQLRSHARRALAEYGNAILEKLGDVLDSPGSSELICTAIPKVIALIGTQEALNWLSRNLGHANLAVRNEVIRALKVLKKQRPRLRFDREIINESLISETRAYNEQLLHLSWSDAPSLRRAEGREDTTLKRPANARYLLCRALEEQLENNLERIFDLLGVKYSAKDMDNAYKGVRSDKAELRANAIEFLDNYLDSRFKRLIIPLVESYPLGFDLAERRSPYDPESERKSLEILLTGDTNWLKACALFLIAEERDGSYKSFVQTSLDDQDSVVRETAAYALARLDDEDVEEPKGASL